LSLQAVVQAVAKTLLETHTLPQVLVLADFDQQ
jgi:hypothetical protein